MLQSQVVPLRLAIFFIVAFSLILPQYSHAVGVGYNVDPSMTESTIQSTIYTACESGSGNLVHFAAGSYTGWDTVLNVPAANGCIITGPSNASQPFVGTAILNSDGNIPTTGTIMALTSCSGSTPGASATIEYLSFEKTGGIDVGASCGGFEITHNEFTGNNPAIGSSYHAAIDMDGTGSQLNSGWDISWNNFHDNCELLDAHATYTDYGGYCAATFVNGSASNATWNNNTVNTMEQGFKIVTTSGSYISGVKADYNYFINWHRIAIEWQTASSSTLNNEVKHNYLGPPFDPCYLTFAISVPLYGTGSPASDVDDNTIISTTPVACGGSQNHYGIAIELWGNGAESSANLIEGGPSADSGYRYSLGAGSGASITQNIASGYDIYNQGLVGIDSSAGEPTDYTITPNSVTLANPTIVIPTPIISAVSGAQVTITDSGVNTTIYYTIDGSTPTVNSTIYTGPFTPPNSLTIKAIAQWGTGANTRITFPSGYGYTPSAVASASYESSGGTAPSAPTSLAAVAANGSVGLNWTGSSGAISYNIYRGTSSGHETELTTGISNTFYTDSSVVNATTYFYEVTAVNSSGESGRSNEATATPTSGGSPSNLIQDPGFETSSSLAPYWSVNGSPTSDGIDTSSADSHSGNNDGFIYDDSGAEKSVSLSQTITVTANTTYTLTGWVDAYNTTGGLLGVRTTGGTNIGTTSFTNTDPGPSTHGTDYRQYTVTFNSGSNTSVAVFVGYTTPGTASFINVDDLDMSLVASNLIQDPGFETSSSLAPYWSVNGSPTSDGIDTSSADSHSGNNDGFIYDDSGAEKSVSLSQTITVTANTTYTLTGWVDAYNTTGGLLGVRTTGGTNIGTTSFTNTDPGPSTHGTDYRQYTVTFNSGSNTSVAVFVGYTTPGTASFINVDDLSLVSN